MALKYNSNQVNEVFWNYSTSMKPVNETYTETVTTIPNQGSESIGNAYWSATFYTEIPNDVKDNLTVDVSRGEYNVYEGYDGYVYIVASGTHLKTGVQLTVTCTVTGSYLVQNGVVNKVMFDGRLAWVKPNTKLTDLTGSTWKFKIQVKKTTMSNFSIKFKSNYGEFYGMQLAYSSESDYATSLKYDRGDGTALYVYPGASSIHWQNGEAYRTFTITGGSDVTNQTLINWLYSTADLVL